MNALTLPVSQNLPQEYKKSEMVICTVGDQHFGIPVLHVRDVLKKQAIAPVPLADEKIAGSINLRGRIVTAINVRKCLGLPHNYTSGCMHIVVPHEDELYSLMVDGVSDVTQVPLENFESNPATLNESWKNLSDGIYRLNERLLVVLNTIRLIDMVHQAGNGT